jgi:adenylate cyclase
VDPKFFKDKIVVVGATAVTLQDLHRTPTSGDSRMAGPEVQANAIGTVLDDFPLHSAPGWFNALLIILLGMTTPIASLWLNPRGAFGAALGVAVLFTFATILGFASGVIWIYVYPMLALALTSIAALGVNYVSASYERQHVRGEFARFAPDSVVDQILANTDGDASRLGGKRMTATLLFSDLRGFTSFSEKLPPEKVIAILNDYLTEMSDAILDHNGTLVSFMGDGIMAVFGAPLETDDHADQALATARDMLHRMHGFNARLADEGLGKGFKMGIGLNTGPVMSGNVGSERRMEYTTIGDTTNTAARLEALTKGTDFQLYLSEQTKVALHEAQEDLVFVESLAIRGREQGVNVWGLVESKQDGPPADIFESVS